MSKCDSSGISGVTTAMLFEASSRESVARRGSSMPAAWSPETSRTRRRGDCPGRYRRARIAPVRAGIEISRSLTLRALRSAIRRTAPCMSAARTTKASPVAYGRTISASPTSATTSASQRRRRTECMLHSVEGIRDLGFGIRNSRSRPLTIAIDGPSGAGKGTVARAVANELGYRHVDSGAMYRAVGWKALREGVPLDQDEAVAALAAASAIDITDEHVAINGIDVTRAIRTPEIDRAAAAVARLPKVRAVLVERQRRLGAGGAMVMQGRDIGTVVFPHADVKIYLDASPEERARRRAADPAHTGGPSAVSEVATLLTERDQIDRTRIASPLYAAADAIVVDTTGKPIEEVVREVLEVIRSQV